MRDAKPLASPPDDRGAAARRRSAMRCSRHRRRTTSCSSTAPSCRRWTDRQRRRSGRDDRRAVRAGSPTNTRVRGSARSCPSRDDLALALNTAFMTDGAVIHVSEGRPDRHGRSISRYRVRGEAPAAMYPRSLVVRRAGRAGDADREHEGRPGSTIRSTRALELVVGDGAQVDHIKIGARATRRCTSRPLMATIGAQARASRVHLHHRRRGDAQQLFLRFAGEGTIASIAAPTCSRAASTPTRRWCSTMRSRGCKSREVFKSVLDDESRGVFQGKIMVRPRRAEDRRAR